MNEQADATPSEDVGGFLGRQHHRLRFNELPETLFARIIATKCPDLSSKDAVRIRLSLQDLFRKLSASEIEGKLANVSFTYSEKNTELFTDFLNAILGADLEPHRETAAALDFYHSHVESRLKWLSSGEEKDGKLPCIEGFTKRTEGNLIIFDISVRPSVLVERLATHIAIDFELNAKLLRDIMRAQKRPIDPGARIDYRKQVELLTAFLDERQKLTSEIEFTILSSQIPFRWALQVLASGPPVAAPGIGTTTAVDKVMLPLLLELNGHLDILDINIESDPLEPHNVILQYSLRRPAVRNIFSATTDGLEPASRSLLNETELVLYCRLHRRLQECLVFGGRSKLEVSFGQSCSWLIRKAAYCLEEPSFLSNPARDWLKQQNADSTIQMEDRFFLPAIYERLRSDFGSKVVKKPERFGGEIDILFDDTIPIELKVRRGRKGPLNLAEIDDAFPPAGQAAAYASVSRVGIVAILDLPDTDAPLGNLESCATVVEKRFPEDSPYPTCIVVISFRCHHFKPSAAR
jgi:hypothetical protein